MAQARPDRCRCGAVRRSPLWTPRHAGLVGGHRPRRRRRRGRGVRRGRRLGRAAAAVRPGQHRGPDRRRAVPRRVAGPGIPCTPRSRRSPLPAGELSDALAQISWPDEVAGCVLVQEIVVLPPAARGAPVRRPDAAADAGRRASRPHRGAARRRRAPGRPGGGLPDAAARRARRRAAARAPISRRTCSRRCGLTFED